jgi:hypothetical protein
LNDYIVSLLELRVAVAFLGEKGNNGWWQTQFLQPTGQRFLEFIYPRTVFAAAVNAAAEAAKSFHDQRIGKGRVFHLFRFPFSVELHVHQQLLSDTARVAGIVKSASTARALLERYAKSSNKTGSSLAGPLCVGDVSLIFSGRAASKLSEVYRHSIGSATPALPYLTDASE